MFYNSLSHGDNELFLDIYNDGYMQILLEELKKGEPIILKEWLNVLPSSHKHFISQFVLPLKKKIPTHYKKADRKTNEKSGRSYYPGSEWAYFKIYCSTGFSDIVLKKVYSHVINPLQKQGKILKWFFIRYPDPHYHIRLRLLISQDQSIAKIVKLIHEKLEQFLRNGVIWRIQMDTYQRELERYGRIDMEKSESIFHLDSELFIRILNSTDIEGDSRLRLLAAVKNVDNYLSIIGLDVLEKRIFCKKMADHYENEHSKAIISDVRQKYKECKDELVDFLKNDSFKVLFEAHARAISHIGINKMNLSDFIHLSINRWFVGQQREWEYLTYYFCRNYYDRLIHTTKPND